MKKKKKAYLTQTLPENRKRKYFTIYLINTTFIPKPDKEVVTKKHSGQSKS